MFGTALRTLAFLIGLALLLLAARTGRHAVDYARRVDRWEAERAVDVDIEPGFAGEVRSQFAQTCGVAHGQAVMLRAVGVDGRPVDPAAWAKGLDYTLRLDHVDPPGPSEELDPGNTIGVLGPGEPSVCLHYGHFPSRAVHRIRFRFLSPPPGEGIARYELTTRNVLCGLERMPVVVGGVIAAAAGMVGLGLFVPQAVRLGRRPARKVRSGH